jgi:hypothetical protein
MDADKAKGLIKRQIDRAEPLKNEDRFSAEWKKWHRDTQIVLNKIFGNGNGQCGHSREFARIKYAYGVYSDGIPDHKYQKAFLDGLAEAQVILRPIIEEIEDFGLVKHNTAPPLSSSLAEAFERFHLMARQLRGRHKNRATLNISDEYDVQDLLHSILHLFVDDIRAEEWTPSYAGKSSRVDFLLKKERTVIEAKKTRAKLGTKEVVDQLLVDIGRYQAHPDCDSLICFVYDPEGRIPIHTALSRT